MAEQKPSDHKKLLSPSSTVSFADVAHQTLIFDTADPTSSLVLRLIDTKWMQRLRNIRQTGNTHLVYMFAEHSRFGHSLGVAYLATVLMRNLAKFSPDAIQPYELAVAAAALLHDVGHTAPGSHLAERLWNQSGGNHEAVTVRIIQEDPEIRGILDSVNSRLADDVCKILAHGDGMPQWTAAIISGGGWNADRGNWAIVDSAMCSVSYGRYNVAALIDAFRLSQDGQLVLLESRLDALTHFFVARDSMYRQVYQHRVLQAADAMTANVVQRLSDLLTENAVDISSPKALRELLSQKRIVADDVLVSAIAARASGETLPLSTIFQMTESWWRYHLDQWCFSEDKILSDLCTRLRDRRLLKTIRLDRRTGVSNRSQDIVDAAQKIATELGFDPRYYVMNIGQSDIHRGKAEEPPHVLLDNGELVSVAQIEPLIAKLLEPSESKRVWLAVPREVKAKLGLAR